MNKTFGLAIALAIVASVAGLRLVKEKVEFPSSTVIDVANGAGLTDFKAATDAVRRFSFSTLCSSPA